ncbi:hypothetical protein F66182_11372, partial [Fusarium sp. NRRL 66182]
MAKNKIIIDTDP